MYLKSLELHGFKSFPDKTVLKFNSGTTVIVGPNGSGKSNITDAMRWVLGELSSKNIRGNKMEDVIFAGSDDMKPMSFAEVSVTFDDSEQPKSLQSEYDEVTVTRRYYRSGDSEYYINRKKCRLKDIYQLFMNTGIGREGYSIIGQGRIAEIISKKSDERRGVFEESAGIAKYRYKKTESEKKLAETEANMERVGDIESELGARIGPLEKESEKARRYLELYGEKKKTDISLWIYDSDRMREAISKTEKDTLLSAHELEMAEDSIKATSAQIERLYEQSHENKEASRRNYEETTAANRKISEARAESKVMLREKLHAENSLESEKKLFDAANAAYERDRARLDEILARLESTAAEKDSVTENSRTLGEEIEAKNKSIADLTAQLDELFAKQKNSENAATDLKVRLSVLKNSIKAQSERSRDIEGDIEKYKKEIDSLNEQAQNAKKQSDEYKSAVAEIENSRSIKKNTLGEYSSQCAELEKKSRTSHAGLDSLDSRINAVVRMQEHFDGYNNSIKHIMGEAKAGRLSGIRGPLSYLIKVEKDYIVAIETSLGGALQNIVTDDENAAKASIESLKRSNAGRATFYPLTTIKASERGREYDGLENTHGFIGWADELVSSKPEYRNIIKSLLARVAVYDNIDNAMSAAKSRGWRIRAVTLDGQQINAGGSFTGGQTKRDSGMLSRSSLVDSLRAEREKLSSETESVDSEIKKLRDKIAAIRDEITREEDKKSLIEVLISTEERNYSDVDGKRKAIGELIDNMEKDRIQLAAGNSTDNENLRILENKIAETELKLKEITEKRSELSAIRGETELEADALGEKMSDAKIRLAELARDIEAASETRNDTESRLSEEAEEAESRRKAITELEEKIKQLELTSAEKDKEADELDGTVNELNARQEKLDETGDMIEAQINSLRQTEKDQNAKKDILFVAHSKNEAKLNGLRSEDEKLSARMWEDYELTYAAAVKFAEENDCHLIEDGERTKYSSMQNELKQKIKSLGHVNVDSIDEYLDVKKRYEYIKKQLDDLRASREDLLGVLSGIEDDMKRIFTEAFAKINKYFGEVFRELFGGGHAEVILTDPENALESGIEINAAPPGKTIKNLNLLSGGEQAFIAIALLFALIKVNPSPFCIFDEIEAALDEVNVTRVGRYIKKYSHEMQIIMISHRRGTMDIADTLYGVTMQSSGVSKVFTLSSGEGHEDLLR